MGWLRERRVLLPGVTTLVRLVASRRESANQRLWETLYRLLDDEQRSTLDVLLEVPDGQGIRSWTSCGGRPCGCRDQRWSMRSSGLRRSWGWGSPRLTPR
ncbi:hypothetical protein ACFQ0O_10205 [Saccharopolyspora spinosporotrichia]